MTDIRTMLDDLGLASADFSADLPDAYGRPQPAFRQHCKGSVIRLPLPTAGGVQKMRILTEARLAEGGAA